MSGDQNSGDKTEKATPKKLQDAKKKGDIAKSRDITNTVILIAVAIALWQASGSLSSQFYELFDLALGLQYESLDHQVVAIGVGAVKVLLIVSAFVFIPVIVIGMLTDFFQVGAIFTVEKMKPKMSHLNPAEGLKRVFSLDSLFELFKSILKTSAVFGLAAMVAYQIAPAVLGLSTQTPDMLASQMKGATLSLLLWTCVVFVFLSGVDSLWQKHSFAKKMKMSMRDIKQEYKDMEGDPHMKSHRKQTAQEWAQEGASTAAQNASVLIVNPTHIAIAINYHAVDNPVPVIAAQGEMDMAVMMREAAEKAQVPIVRNQQLARTLLANTQEGDFIPGDLFDIVAEVILWAEQVKKTIANENEENTRPTPGEDLTNYARAT